MFLTVRKSALTLHFTDTDLKSRRNLVNVSADVVKIVQIHVVLLKMSVGNKLYLLVNIVNFLLNPMSGVVDWPIAFS